MLRRKDDLQVAVFPPQPQPLPPAGRGAFDFEPLQTAQLARDGNAAGGDSSLSQIEPAQGFQALLYPLLIGILSRTYGCQVQRLKVS